MTHSMVFPLIVCFVCYTLRTYIILFWTKYFKKPIELYLNNNTVIDSKYCSNVSTLWPSIATQCVVTSDRAYLSFSKGLVFHMRDLNSEDMPSLRRSDQLWTLYNLEAPTHTSNIFRDNYPLFNITSSYRTDSDIYVPYGRLTKRDSNFDNKYLNRIDFKSKSKLIVWFVSNCETPGRRELYVHKLSQYIPIDIYGKCGQLTCDPPRSAQCFQRAAKEYKFYLSFENSICRDYVTEKLFEALDYDILPVVFGGSDYHSFMPPNSFIDANRLTPQELAKHLTDIASNEHKYLSYFKWKQTYSVESGLDRKFEVLCHLCQILNTHKTYISRSNDQLINWWFKRAKCKAWMSSSNTTNNYNNIY